jgi:hypothetical protein
VLARLLVAGEGVLLDHDDTLVSVLAASRETRRVAGR